MEIAPRCCTDRAVLREGMSNRLGGVVWISDVRGLSV